MGVNLKVCCIKSMEEADLAIDLGANAIGLVGPMPSGPGIIDEETIIEIVKHVGSKIETFLLTSETQADAIVAHHRRTNTSTIQLVDSVSIQNLKKIRIAMPEVRIVQVIHVVDDSAKNEALEVSPYVDALLLDSGQPKAKERTLGGTGQTHNWDVSREIVNETTLPVYLAGGINQGNVVDAVNLVSPYGIDLCSGLRRDDQLQLDLLQSFVLQLKSL